MFCRICLSNQIVKIVKAGTFDTVEMSIELLETLGSSYQGTKASYQGIGFRDAKRSEIICPFRGPSTVDFFSTLSGVIQEVSWCGA